MRFFLKTALCALAVAAAAVASAQAAEPAPYGTNDAGGFRNVLPPGEAGVDNALQLGQFQAGGDRPPHWVDQLPLYNGLITASPHLTAADIPKYFKDATFGVKPDDVASTEHPRAGVTIVRDKAYGVPRIYGDTAGDVEFGAGYAAAADRLFFIDILRHTGRAELSSFIGGSPGNREMDRTQWSIAPYREADLQRQIDLAPTVYGPLGTQLVAYGNEFVKGINQYVDEALADPSKLPGEYVALGKLPERWTLTDVIAEASLIGGIFGKGGGNELRSAMLLEALQDRFGSKKGQRAWADFRSKNDPEARTTILRKKFPYETTSAFSTRGLALPDRGSVSFTPPAPPVASSSSLAADNSVGAQLLRTARGRAHASNWLMIPARYSKSGHPLGVLGPQVGYYVPEVLMEEELHGPGFDARGATFPGVNLMVQLGHGRDYAWSATTATSDNVDTFAEVLCQDDVHYMWKGSCRPMDKLERSNSWAPNGVDQTAPGSETLTAYRTVHGIVYARGTVRGQKVAYVSARSTYGHEADSAIGLFRLNDPSFTHDPESFRKAIDGISFAFNWGYIDSKHTAYQLSGWYPKRAPNTSPDFPILGTGEYDWQGWNPDLNTMDTVPLDARPHAVDQRYLISWNNKQSPRWAAADDIFAYGPLARQQMLVAFVRRALAKGKMRLEQLVQAMEEPATQDLRALAVLPIVRRAIGTTKDARLRQALDLLERWRRSGAHRRDLNGDGRYDDDAAVTLMDAWWPKLAEAEFAPALGEPALKALRQMQDYGDIGTSPSAPDFFGGFWGFTSKDLRDLFQRRYVHGRWSRTYCGTGSKSRCRAALRGSLEAALGVTREQMYAKGACKSNPQASCYDMNRFTVASGIDAPDMPFQNRPTFQQTVEIPHSAPR